MNGLRVVQWLLVVLASGAGAVAGVAGAALRTDAGRSVIAAEAVAAANTALNGSLTVDSVGGSFLDGLVARGVTLRDTNGDAVVTIERLALRYRWRDLLSGRITLGQVILDRPVVVLVQAAPGEQFNVEAVLPRGDGEGPGRLIAFSDVRVRNGDVTLRTPNDDAESGPRVRRITGIEATFDYLRLSSPRADQPGIRIEIAALAARLDDPALHIGGLRGSADVWGDSLGLALDDVHVGDTRGAVRGTLRWPADTLLLDLTARATRLATDDLRSLVAALPPGLAGRGNFVIRSLSGDAVDVRASDLALEGGGGRLEGRLGMELGPGDHWTARGVKLRLRDFDLEFVRGLLDTLPLAGRLTGTVAADGPPSRLALEFDVSFRDSLVPGWPRSDLRGAGIVELHAAEGAILHGMHLAAADVQLATLNRLLPAVELQGRLSGAGTLNGPWLAAAFDGTLRHQDAPRPETVARGTVRIDARGELLAVWADLTLDSLRLAGLGGAYPAIDHDVVLGGRVALAGRVDSLVVDAVLGGPTGALRAAAALYLLDDRTGAHYAAVTFTDANLAALDGGLPRTSLTGSLDVRGGVVRGQPPELHAELALVHSHLAGVRLDSARALVSLGDSVVTLNVLRAWGGGWQVQGGGRLGAAAPRRGTITISATIDSAAALEPLLTRWLGDVPPGTTRGSIGGSVTLEGALDAFEAAAAVQTAELRRGDRFVSRAQARMRWVSPGDSLELALAIDSAGVGPMGFGRAQVAARGPADSLAWFARGRFGTDGAFLGGGTLRSGAGRVGVTVDSLGVLLGTGIWFAERGASVVVSDSGVDFDGLALASVRHAGRVSLSGRFPFAGRATLDASIEALPLEDVAAVLQRESRAVGGELSGTLHLAGRPRDPEVEVRLGLRDAVVGDLRVPAVRMAARYADRRLTADVTLHRAGQQILRLEGAFPVDLALAGAERRRLPGALRVRALADGVDLSLFEATTPLVRNVRGSLTADFGVAGTWEQPVLTGSLSVANGAATLPALGVRHEQLNATLVFSGDTVHVRQLSVRSGAGTAQVNGYVRLRELTRPMLELAVRGENFRAIDVRDFLTLTASGDLQLTGPFFGATLRGRATANRGVLYFADLIEKDVINLQDTLYREFLDTMIVRRHGLGPELDIRFLDSLRVDSLRVEMGSDMWLRSGEANIQLSGEVTVSKVRDEYRFNGTLQTPRGTYRLELPPPFVISKDFTVTRGQVRYFGTPDLNADLDIDARHVVRTLRGDPVTVFVHIGGTLYEPQLTLSSDIRPPVSETEVISYLLFGAPSVQAFERAGVAGRAVAEQTLQNALSIITGRFEQSLVSDLGIPVDYLQIRPGELRLTGTEFAVGKQFYLFGTTGFLTARQRVCPQEIFSARNLGASLEFRLSREWLLATGLDPAQSCTSLGPTASDLYQFGLDLVWEKRF